LLTARADLEKTQKELEKKFSETSQFTNMKQMLTKKNEQLKELRTQLRKYEPDAET
jgi:leucine zipper transcription factor-like protein 1